VSGGLPGAARRLFARRHNQQSPAAAPPDEPLFSVLDCGTSAIKALVVRAGEDFVELLGAASEPSSAGVLDVPATVEAAERALVAAEDAAGILPRRVVIGLSGRDGVAGEAEAGPNGERDLRGARRRANSLAEALDLEVVVISLIDAIGRALAGGHDVPAIAVDAGARGTTVLLSGATGMEITAWIPLGGGALEQRLRDQLGVNAAGARDAVMAHAAGAARHSGAGAAAGRTIMQLAQHHADVWRDAFEVACAGLHGLGVLPHRILLFGGGAALPDLSQAISGGAWHATLPFEKPPAVRVLDASDVPHVRQLMVPGLGPAFVPAACLAVAHARGMAVTRERLRTDRR